MRTTRIPVGIGLVMLLTVATPAVYAAQNVMQDSVVDRIGDWFATVGKSGMEKQTVLTQRQMARAAKRTGHAVHQQARQAQQDLEAAGRQANEGLRGVTNQQ